MTITWKYLKDMYWIRKNDITTKNFDYLLSSIFPFTLKLFWVVFRPVFLQICESNLWVSIQIYQCSMWNYHWRVLFLISCLLSIKSWTTFLNGTFLLCWMYSFLHCARASAFYFLSSFWPKYSKDKPSSLIILEISVRN